MKGFVRKRNIAAKVHVAPEADRDITEIFEYLLEMEGLEVAKKLVATLVRYNA